MIGELRTVHLMGALRRKGHDLSEDALRAEWTSVDRIKRAAEPPLVRTARAFFRDQEREVLSRLPVVLEGRAPKARKDPFIVSQLIDMATWLREVELRFGQPVLQAIERGFDIGLSRVSVTGVDFTSDAPQVRISLSEILNKTKEMNATTADQLGRLIQDHLSSGATIGDIERSVREMFEDWQGWRADTVAQTAATGGFESGQQNAFEEAEIDDKRWLSQRDGRVRVTHLEADGQQVSIRESFIVGKASLKHPGDPAGPAGEVIRCRCTSIPVIRSE